MFSPCSNTSALRDYETQKPSIAPSFSECEGCFGLFHHSDLKNDRCEACTPKCLCGNPVHACSENAACAACELQTWKDELKHRAFQNPPDPSKTAHAHIQVLIWQAHVKEEA